MKLQLKELRKQSGMTQQELASKLGVTQATLSGWETGKYEIDNESLRRCSKIFMVSMDYLFNASMDSEEIAYARKKTKELYEQQSPDIKSVEDFLDVNFATFRSWYQGLGDYFSNVSNLIKLADLFKVSLYVLLGKSDKEPSSSLNEQLSGIDFALWSETQDMTDAEKQDIIDYIQFRKTKRTD